MRTLRCIALVFVLCASFTSLSTKVSAQPALCVPDCPADLFIPQPPVILTISGGCQVLVEYATRVACGVWYDLQITKITPITIGCGIHTPAQILNLTTLALMQANPMGFPPVNPGDCNTNWRVSRASCWKFKAANPEDPFGGSYVPCDQNVCCLQAYRVCLDDSGNRIITHIPTPPPGPCPAQTDPSAVCYHVCN